MSAIGPVFDRGRQASPIFVQLIFNCSCNNSRRQRICLGFYWNLTKDLTAFIFYKIRF